MQHPHPRPQVTATSPLNIAIALTFDWIGYGMLGFRHRVLAAAQNSACAVLLALIAMQWVQVGGRRRGRGRAW